MQPSQSTNWGSEEEMRILKRNGELEPVSFDKILQRFRRVGKEVEQLSTQKDSTKSASINYPAIAMKVIDQLYDKISSSKIDELCAEQCASLASTHPDYTALAGRIVVSSHHKNTDTQFSKVVRRLHEFRNFQGKQSPIVSDDLYLWSVIFGDDLEQMIDYERDYMIDYFGFKTLERAYLLRLGGKQIVERPQHMWMRVAVAIHGTGLIDPLCDVLDPSECREVVLLDPKIKLALAKIRETYDGMSMKQFIHATPTLFNAGTPRPQLSSCFLLAMESDSIDGIYNTLKDCATISKWAGGIGLHIHNVRASGSYIEGTGGTSNGIVPMLRVFNHTAKYVDQCVNPETKVIFQDPITGENSWRDIKDLQAGDRIHNIPIDDPEGFGQAAFLATNDTNGPNTQNNTEVSVRPVHPGTADPVSIFQLDGDKYRKNTDVVKSVVKSAYSGEMLIFRTKAPAFFLRLTPDHPVLIVRQKMRLDPNDIYDHNGSRGRLEWVSARDVTVGTSFLIFTNSFLDVESIETEWYEGDVYDLEMETYPNYMTNFGLVHNGGGKRNGSFAIYLEPWHADVELFLQMRKNHGDEELKARDLFYALWVPDLFMERMQSGGDWTLMCPNECPGLADVHGAAFNELYESYEKAGRGRKTMKARDLWLQILDAQMETGTPYLCYKDSANRKSNQQNLGTIKSSNLCVAPETFILTDTGNVQISTVCGQTVNVWNGCEWSPVEIKKTGENQKVIKIFFHRKSDSKYYVIRCTPYHKFYVMAKDEEGDEPKIKEVRAVDLTLDSILIPFQAPAGEYGHMSYDSIRVCGVEDFGEIADTYCFTEPKRNMGVFNGILTGQCAEIVEYSDDKETAVCNLASIALPAFCDADSGTFDFEGLYRATKTATYNLNRVIDINYYPTEKTRLSNLRHRPIGIGVQGLADTFILMGFAFSSSDALDLNRRIFETIYYAAVEQSMELAAVDGPYESFAGSPASKGQLQFDLWSVDVSDSRYDWTRLKSQVVEKGLRNSLLLAPMPTASTSQILGYNECIEPITSNIFSRRTLAGEFILCNKYLMRDLMALGLWSEKIKNNIIANNGSVQQLDVIPIEIREKYKTVWELSMKTLIDMAADRGAFIDQSQSLNLWIEDPNYARLTSMHVYAWSKGLKTGIYYLRRRAKHQAQKFTIEPDKKGPSTNTSMNTNEEGDHEICEFCSS